MSQAEKTPGQVLHAAIRNALDHGDPIDKELVESLAAAVIAHHEAGKADEVATLRVRVADLEAQLAERRVVVPELTAGDMDKGCRESGCFDPDSPATTCFRDGMEVGYALAASRVRAIDPATEVVVAKWRLEVLEKFPLAVDAFLAESTPWTSPNGPCAVSDLVEIAGRRLGYMLEQLAALREGKA